MLNCANFPTQVKEVAKKTKPRNRSKSAKEPKATGKQRTPRQPRPKAQPKASLARKPTGLPKASRAPKPKSQSKAPKPTEAKTETKATARRRQRKASLLERRKQFPGEVDLEHLGIGANIHEGGNGRERIGHPSRLNIQNA